MNLYNEPAFQSEVVTQGLLGESNDIIDTSENWFKIKQWDGYESWAHSFYGVVQDQQYINTHTFFGNHGLVYDHRGASIRSIHFGSKLNAEGHEEHFKVVLPDGKQGIIRESLTAEHLSPNRKSIIDLSKSFVGTPYFWGGKSTLGFDCSGFVQSIFKAHGIELSRDSHKQADQLQETIDVENCKPGDLLFFAENERVSHVAISLGGKELINARGWVRCESLDLNHENYSQKLKDLFDKAVSIRSVVKD